MTDTSKKPREFWFDLETTSENEFVVNEIHLEKPEYKSEFHVIEYSAYEQLKSDYDKLKEENQRISDENLKCKQDLFIHREEVKQRQVDIKNLEEENQ